MKEAYFQLIFLTLALLVVVVFRTIIIPKFMENLHKKIKNFVQEISKDTQISEKSREESMEQLNLIEKRKDKLGFITIWVGRIELFVFIFLTILIFIECSSVLAGSKVFGAFLGGWIAIKVLSNHGPWSDKVVGKAYYHQSLIGTLLNVAAGFISGLLIYLGFFSSY